MKALQSIKAADWKTEIKKFIPNYQQNKNETHIIRQ